MSPYSLPPISDIPSLTHQKATLFAGGFSSPSIYLGSICLFCAHLLRPPTSNVRMKFVKIVYTSYLYQKTQYGYALAKNPDLCQNCVRIESLHWDIEALIQHFNVG